MSNGAKANVEIGFEGGEKTLEKIKSWLSKQNKSKKISFYSEICGETERGLMVELSSVSEQNLEFQLNLFADFLRSVKEVKNMESEVWIMGCGVSFERG